MSLFFVLGLSCNAAQPAAPQAAAAKPSAAPAKADPSTEWVDGLFAWGAGQTTLEEISTVKIPGTRIFLAKRTYTADPRMNDQAYLFVEDGGKVLIGDIFYDEDRAKSPAPVRTDADLDEHARPRCGSFSSAASRSRSIPPATTRAGKA